MIFQIRLSIALSCLFVFVIDANADSLIDYVEIEKPNSKLPIAFIKKVKEAPTLDGKMSDSCWKDATSLELLRNTYTGLVPKERSWFKVAYDDQNIYIFAKLEEMYKDRLLGKQQKKRDVYGGDNIEIFIGSEKVDQFYYQFICNLKYGSRYDGDSKIGKKYNPEGWDFKIDKESMKKFINVELKIPASAVNRKLFSNGSLIKFNVCRTDFISQPPFKYWPKKSFRKAGQDIDQVLSQWSVTNGNNKAFNLFGDLYFGSKLEFEKSTPPLKLNFILDREIYDGQDTYAQVVVQPLNEGDKAEFNMNLYREKELLSSAKRVLNQTDFSFLLPIASLSEGKYRLSLSVKRKDGKVVKKERVFFKRIKESEKKIRHEGLITLNFPKRENAKDDNWMVRTGIPFPKGSLWDQKNIRLLKDGVEIPAQMDVRGYWSPNGSIRWMGLSFTAECKNGIYPKYQVEYGKKIERKSKFQSEVRIQESDDSLLINTGVLKCKIDKKHYRGLSKVWIDKNKDNRFGNDEIVVEANVDQAPYVMDKHGHKYLSSHSRDVSFVIEERGPAQAVVKVEGWFENKKVGKLCKYITYYEFFSGQEKVLVDHAVIITFDTNKNNLADVGFTIAAKGSQGSYGIDRKKISVQRDKRTFALQERWNAGYVKNGKTTKGEKIAPWIDVGEDHMGVTLYAQYIAERFPKEFSLDQEKMTFHFWPKDLKNTFNKEEELERKNIYKFFYAHEGPILDFKIPDDYLKAIAKFKEKEWFDYIYTKNSTKANAQGIAINEAFVLEFRNSKFIKEKAYEVAELFRRDPHAMPSPEWMTGSGAFGNMIAVDRENYPELENYLEKTFLSRCWKAIKQNDEYGVWNFGDVHTYWKAHLGYAGIHRVWLSHHHGQTNIPWLLYAHFGDEKFLEWARINSHHTMNINIVHYDDPSQPLPYHKTGNIYHGKGLVHWGGDAGTTVHYAFVRYLQFKWCLTGSRRSRDISKLWVERVIAENLDGSPGRDTVTFVGDGLEFYKNSRDPRLLIQLKRKAEKVMSIPLNEQHAYNWNRVTFLDYHAMTGDQKLLERLKAPPMIEGQGLFNNPAYLYLLEGDLSYLKKSRYFKDKNIGLYELVRGYYENSEDKIFNGSATFFGGGGWISQCGTIESLFTVQAALKKAGLKIELKKDNQRNNAVMNGKYTRGYPYPHSWWFDKKGKAEVFLEHNGKDELSKIIIKNKNKKQVENISENLNQKRIQIPTKKKGLYEVELIGERKGKTRDLKVIETSAKNSFVKLEKGKTYGLYRGCILKIIKKPRKKVSIKISGGDKHPSRLSVLDKNLKEVSFATVWQRSLMASGKKNTLVLPSGKQAKYLHSSMEITLTPSETIEVRPIQKLENEI